MKTEREEEIESQEHAEAVVHGSASNVWTSPMIPPTIRRPWRVFEEDLEDKLACYLAKLEAVQGHGAQATFATLPEDLQRDYAEVSLKELSAYVRWRRANCAKRSGETPMQFEFAWHVLDRDDKARWVPEDHRAVLMADAIWAPLLVHGPPACDFASPWGKRRCRKGGRSTAAKAKVAKTEKSGQQAMRRE